MQRFEYKVVPAPKKGEKAKGAKTTPERFAVALMNQMNLMGAEGWEYLRADTLPCEERVGLTGSKSQFHHMLVFRRSLDAPATASKTGAAHIAPAISSPAEVPVAKVPMELFQDSAPDDFAPNTKQPHAKPKLVASKAEPLPPAQAVPEITRD